MGLDSQQPYIYEASLQHKNRIAYPYSDFNPRAYTQASYAALQQQQEKESRPKSTGPLINFNQHPDSYMVVSGQNVKYEPMPENTKTRMKWVRIVQLSMRVLQELGSLGLLVCVICIKGMATSLSWIFRIAPAWDALITLYAIYHLARNAKSRPPASSASYHMFALFMDTGLIPFFIFIAIFADNNYQMPANDSERWTTFFNTEADTTLVLLVTFVASATLAGLHLVTGILDVWLIITFRNISKLPPDMNPLEDNLTARPSKSSKHKYKNSEATNTSESLSEKDWKYLSGDTLSVGTTPLGKGYSIPDPRQMPFMHSRTDSNSTFSPHNPETARLSRQQFENGGMYDQRNDSAVIANSPLYTETSINVPQLSGENAQSASYASTRRGGPQAFPTLPNVAPTNAVVKSQQKQSLLNDNWYVMDDDEQENNNSNGNVKQVSSDVADQHPLRMNPPTPQRSAFPEAEDDDVYTSPYNNHLNQKRAALTERGDKGNAVVTVTPLNRTLTGATESSSVYSESAPSLKSSLTANNYNQQKNRKTGGQGNNSSKTNTTPKGKYYGNLSAATLAVRGRPSNASLNAQMASVDSTGLSADFYGFAASPPPEKMHRSTPNKKSPAVATTTPSSALRDGKGRVVSRSGVDIADVGSPYYYGNDANGGVGGMGRSGGFGVRERRDVSGKIAEEGRGGGGWMRAARWQ